MLMRNIPVYILHMMLWFSFNKACQIEKSTIRPITLSHILSQTEIRSSFLFSSSNNFSTNTKSANIQPCLDILPHSYSFFTEEMVI